MIKLFLPARFRSLLLIVLVFIVANTAIRVLLAALDHAAPHSLSQWLAIFSIGFLFDLVAVSYLLIPFALLALCFSRSARGNRIHAISASVLLLCALAGIGFVVVAEILFWNEFSVRFNFIAVDYLIYSREVLGNIRESYPLGAILPALFAGAVIVFLLIRKTFFRLAAGDGGGFSTRAIAAISIIALPVLSFAMVSENLRDMLRDPSARELSGDGYYDFMHAFRANDLDYSAYYSVISPTLAKSTLHDEFSEAHSNSVFVNRGSAIERDVTAPGPRRKLNVVLVSMESQGADFIVQKFHDPANGGFFQKVDASGHPVDSAKNTYGHAFAIFALAHAFRVTKDERYREAATAAWQMVNLKLRDGEGGFHPEASSDFVPSSSQRTQNPVMHLFEAMLALHEATGSPIALEGARSIGNFVTRRLLHGTADGGAYIG